MSLEELYLNRIRSHAESRYVPSADKVALILTELKNYDEEKSEEGKEK